METQNGSGKLIRVVGSFESSDLHEMMGRGPGEFLDKFFEMLRMMGIHVARNITSDEWLVGVEEDDANRG